MARLSLLAVFACLSAVYLAWGWSDEISDFAGDSSVYMLAARHFSPFWPSSPVFATFTREMVYPPLFPLLIGLFGGSMLAGHLLVVVSLLGATLCLYAWLRAESLGTGAAAGTCLVFALMPGTYLQSLNIWSEPLYLLLSLLTIALEVRAEKEGGQQGPELWWGAAAAVATATLVRAAALPLLAALAVRLIVVRPRNWRWLVVAGSTPFAIWSAWSRLHQAGVNRYLSQMRDSYSGDPFGVFVSQITTEGRRLLAAWPQAWLADGQNAVLYCLVWVIGAVCMLGWIRRLATLRIDAIYVAIYSVLLFIWPYPAEARRLFLVITPLLLAQGALLIRALANGPRNANLSLLYGLWLGATAIVILPSLILTAQRFQQPLPEEMAVARHTEDWYGDDRQRALRISQIFVGTLNGLKQIGGLVPDGDCVFAIKPSIVALYADRPSYTPPAPASSDEQFDRDIEKCRFAYLFPITTPTISQPLYPIERLKERAQPLLVAKSDREEQFHVYAALVEIGPRK